ncbi:alpha/beta fold hydrolase [Planctomonas sp. JC2975]|uniref:alpha/beta fold hydrolase n=1 Tax=Planctomonas sp. JC2975 TaxID=2729626 RepID=UPI00147448EF|nr:alpha/beta fold hydrolase [Planctomonas sp. JC2975]NNC12562.1 alpha/beta fold hydrolase [Planctomonas sp. JC2975]
MSSSAIRIRPRTRLAMAATAFTLVAGLVGCTNEHAPHRSTSQSTSTSATGTLHWVRNDGHRLAFYVTSGAATKPAIVLDAGGGNDASYWDQLVPRLSKQTGAEIITYDREGMGKSQYVPGAYSDHEEASDLDAGLAALGVVGHSVLVSHSEAGEIATTLVNDAPDAILAAVLIDASLPEFYTPIETARIVAGNAPTVAALEKLPAGKLTAADRQLLQVAENYGREHLEFGKLGWPSTIPVAVIVSASTPFPAGPDADAWRAAQEAFAAQAPNRTLITAAGTSHDVPLDAPGLVAEQVGTLFTTLQ